MAELIGNEVPQAIDNSTQVYKATHEGVERLPLRNRSFISFSYGGRAIEDFNLIATLSDRLQRSVYGEFEDITSEYDVLDGQFYWGTYMKKNSLEFNLSTDAMSEQELNEFKHWFRPGVIRQLILAENPNRAIWARVENAPALSVVPMEQVVSTKINGIEYSTSTTSYRGDIGISFTMDDPYWFAVNPIIGSYYTDKENKFGSVTNTYSSGAIETLSDKDFIKVIIEDGIPHTSMIKDDNIILGNSDKVIQLSNTTPAYLYYCGTAYGRPTIQMTLKPAFDTGDTEYLVWPLNNYSYIALHNDDLKNYNTITIGDRELRFTAPAIYLGYNQAVDIMRNFKSGDSVEEARTALRDNVYEYHSRNWAMFCIETMIENNLGVNSAGALTDDYLTTFLKGMSYFLNTEKQEDGSYLPANITITIDSKTGEAKGRFTFRTPNIDHVIPSSIENFSELETIILEENVEDMVRSDYLLIETRNSPNANGEITEAQSTKITTDYPEDMCGAISLNIKYQNEYL